MALKTYHGSCHCGAVTFEADLDFTQPSFRCNCSICRRTRFWAAIARPDGFRLLAGKSEQTQYLFNTGKYEHFFCRHCGVRCFGIANNSPAGQVYDVNLGCLEDVNDETLSKIPITYIDGLHEQWDHAPEFYRYL